MTFLERGHKKWNGANYQIDRHDDQYQENMQELDGPCNPRMKCDKIC